MTLLAVERIKLFSTRSPWWCSVAVLALTIGFGALMALENDDPGGMSVANALTGYRFGLMVVLVLAALAVTTEYRFGTIRTTFQAVPNRAAVLLAKTAVVGVLALVLGEVAGFGSWAAAQLFASGPDLALTTAEQWRQVAGLGPLFALAAVLAVGVGALLRQTAGAVTVLVLWSLLVEQLVGLVPRIGPDIQEWMPFMVGARIVEAPGLRGAAPLGPWASLAYFGAVALAVLAVAIVVVHRRDA